MTLQRKLILTYLAVALTTVLVASALIRLTSGQSLMNLVVERETAQLKQNVQDYYTANGTLQGFFFSYNKTAWTEPDPGGSEAPNKPPPDLRELRGVHGLVDAQYRALIPMYGFDIGQKVSQDMLRGAVAVEVDGQTIAYILPDTKLQFKLSAEEEVFLQRTTLAIGLAALAGVLIAVAMSFVLAGGLLKPIRRLTQASQALARGDLEQEVPVTSSDELGQLSATFNQMSADLLKADQQRKRMTADITHDLSTPLQIISGYMEMLEEGEVSLNPQRIEIIKTEIEHLRRLVSDLSTLSQVEAGGLEVQIQPLQPAALLERIFQVYQPIAARQGVTLELQAAEGLPELEVDEGRMVQVLKNLVENALRYTQPGGRIVLGAHLSPGPSPARGGGLLRRSGESGGEVSPRQGTDTLSGTRAVVLSVSDDGAGIEPEDLPYVFERFYRADKSRGAGTGNLGLGLAICKALVSAQGGTIRAESAGKGMGAAMIITFG
jgi:two-component system OmpR family sensor kinase/two-component system sensor histidine kinase BaeS